MFIGRNTERKKLKEELEKESKCTILLYGRRRIGKTALIAEVLKDVSGTVIYHEFHRVTLEKNLEEFSQTIMNAFRLPVLTPFRSLPDAFSFISAMDKKTIVVMDEYSDMKSNARKGEVDSYMRTVIDRLPENVKIIMLGSMLNVMEELLEESNPLFARFTAVMKLGPLNYYDAADFFPHKSHYDQLTFYSIFGGSPYVLSLLDKHKDLESNIEECIIALSGSVRSYIEAVVNMEVGRIAHGITILSMIGNGKKRYTELEDVIGKDAGGVLNKELRKLVELEIISKTVPINKNDRKKTFYEISDPLVRFYFTYIYPGPAILMNNPKAFYSAKIEKSIKDFIARRFESICRQYFALLIETGKRTDIIDIGTYWYDDKENKANGEFDVALKTTEGYEIYDAKFTASPLSGDVAETERRQLMRLPLPLSRWGMISASGFEKETSSYIQLDLEDLFSQELSK